MNFLRPCLLLILHREEAHGYALVDGLGQFGFDPELLDRSLVYRALRDMEAEALLTSEWGRESRGPQRRVYRITAEGEQALEEWAADLRRTRQEVDRLLKAYEAVTRSASRQQNGKVINNENGDERGDEPR
jgi:poly-beta-hydroxybutyrate-responsive repressor